MALLLASLAFAAAAAAPVVGPEIASEPIRTLDSTGAERRPAAPLATDGDGFVLAYTIANDQGKGRTMVARLDSRAQAVPGTARELPVTQPYYDAVVPDIIVAPDGFFVAQNEIAQSSSRVVVWHLDRALHADAAPFAVVPADTFLSPGTVRIAGNRVAVIAERLFLKTTVAEFDLAGTPLRTTILNFVTDDAAFAGGALVTAGLDTVAEHQSCSLFACTTIPMHFDVFLSFDGSYPLQGSYSFYSDDRVGVATDGSTLLYLFDWRLPLSSHSVMSFLRFDATSRRAIDLEPQTIASYEPGPHSPARPAAAFDGTRFLVVWPRAGGDRAGMAAAAIERDGTVTPIDIPNLADETSPFVLAAGPNRFLVSYLSRRGAEFRIAARFITFGRRHVAGIR